MNISPDPAPSNSLLRPRAQRTVSLAAVGVLALAAAVWVRHGGPRGGAIVIDRAPPLTARFQVDVNRAEWPELVQLPGIGPTLAQRWVAERQARGDFRDLEDLSRVGGLGPRTLDRIRPYLLPLPDEAELAER